MASPHTLAKWKCWKEAGRFGLLCSQWPQWGWRAKSSHVCILTLSFSLNSLEISLIQSWKVALGHSSQCFFKLHGQLLIVVISLWNSGATKNYKNSRLGRTYQSQFRVFFYVVELALILQCNGEVLTCFWPFAELLKCIRWTEIYFKHKNRLILFWLMKFLGWSFGRLKPVYQSPKSFGYGPDCESRLRDGNKAFSFSKNHLVIFWNSDDRMHSDFFHPLLHCILASYVNDPSFWVKMDFFS